MNTFLIRAGLFLGQRFLHFIIYAAIGLAIWGIAYKLYFEKREVRNTRIVNEQPTSFAGAEIKTFGCASFRGLNNQQNQKKNKDKKSQ